MSDLEPAGSKKATYTQPHITLFAAEYAANGGNGKQAMLKINPEMTEGSASTLAGRWLRKVAVTQAVEAALRAQIKRIDARGDRVITELFRILSADIKDAFTAEGALKQLNDIPEDLRRAIAAFEVEEIWAYEDDGAGGRAKDKRKVQVGVLKKVKFWSKTESANLLGKHLKLWVESAGIDASLLFSDGDVELVLNIKT